MGLSYGGSFQSFLSEEGGEVHTMRDDGNGGEWAKRRTSTEGRAWEDALGPAP